MRIAVASHGLDVAEHLSSTTNFTCYTTESFNIVSVQNLPIIGSSIDGWAQALASVGMDVLIVDKADDFALQSFTSRGIEVSQNAHGSAHQAAMDFLTQRSRELDLEFKNRSKE